MILDEINETNFLEKQIEGEKELKVKFAKLSYWSKVINPPLALI